jgi:hypothetical protein
VGNFVSTVVTRDFDFPSNASEQLGANTMRVFSAKPSGIGCNRKDSLKVKWNRSGFENSQYSMVIVFRKTWD